MVDKNQILREKIDQIKRELISVYVYLMIFVLLFYSLFFYFVANNNKLSYYLLFGFGLGLYSWVIIRKNYNIERTVHSYIILASIFNLFIIAVFWNSSLASYIWLFPIPFAGYIFFEKKIVIIYILYILLNIVIGYILSQTLSLNFSTFQNRNQLLISDTFIFVFNLGVIFLFLFYNDKIKKVEMHLSHPSSEESIVKIVDTVEAKESSDEEVIKFNILFEKVENGILENEFFKQSDFTISRLSVFLNTNTAYISKSIKQNGYSNFAAYLNKCRVDHFKKLISDNDIKKVTLMYLYTESGFSNQSTFNRVFKQIEGITPSDYIEHLGKSI